MSQRKKVKTALVISAMSIESAYIREYLSEREGWKRRDEDSFEYEKIELHLVTKVIGVGKVNAAFQTADLIAEYHPDIIFNVGYAGGLIKTAKKGDVVIGKEYVQVDFIPFKEENRPFIQKSPEDWIQKLEGEAEKLKICTYVGKIATGDYFLHDSNQKKQIIQDFAPIAFDMESAAVAQVATVKQIPFIAIRTFSDLADDDAADAIEETAPTNESRIPIERRPIVLVIHTLEKI